MLNKFNNSDKKVAILVGGTTLAQLITIFLTPILSRIYRPEDFGLFAIFFSITGILSIIIGGRYEVAIVQPKKNSEAIILALISFALMLLLTIILTFILFLTYENIFISQGINKKLFLFIPIMSFFIGLFNILNILNTRFENYKSISIAKILRSIFQNSIPIFLSFFSINAINILIGYFGGFIATYFSLVKKNFFKKNRISKFSKENFFYNLKKYKVFPLYNAPASIANKITHQLPFIFILFIGGEAINGLYFLAARLISIPTALIGESFSQVFYRDVSAKINQNSKILPLLKNSIKKLFLIAFPVFILIFFLSPTFFPLFLGEEWTDSGIIAQYLGFIFLIQFVVSTVSQLLSIKKFVFRGAFWKYLYLITSLILYSFSYYLNIDFYTFLLFLVIHEYILYSIYLYLIYEAAVNHDLAV
tara:strand:- start:4888 stop:6147 length:1260 start_codon:yes stop_codon:yes gene_type:complete